MDKQEIENESLPSGGSPEEGTYATTHEEVRQGYPVFGRIAGHSEDLEEVEIHIPYTHRLKWKSICYEKNIKAGIIKLTFRTALKSPSSVFGRVMMLRIQFKKHSTGETAFTSPVYQYE